MTNDRDRLLALLNALKRRCAVIRRSVPLADAADDGSGVAALFAHNNAAINEPIESRVSG